VTAGTTMNAHASAPPAEDRGILVNLPGADLPVHAEVERRRLDYPDRGGDDRVASSRWPGMSPLPASCASPWSAISTSSSATRSQRLQNAIRDGEPTELVVVLERVDFLDSGGIRALLVGYHLAGERGVSCWVVNAHGTPRKVLQITGLLDLLAGRP
jgi:anti-anti-sigma factor